MRPSAAEEATITAACRHFVAAKVASVAGLSRTSTSGSYRVRLADGRSVIVKLYWGATSWKAAQERGVIEALTNITAIRTPSLLGGGRLDAHNVSALITADLGDQSLWRAVERGECSRDDALELIGQLLASFHAAEVSLTPGGDGGQRLPTMLLEERVQRQLALLRGDSSHNLACRVEPALRRLVRLGQEARTEVACHGDLHPANVLTHTGDDGALVPYLIDFEATVRGVGEYDLAKSIVTSSALGERERLLLLRGYGDRSSLSEELLYAFVVFHVMDGWIYAACRERRDQSLWRSRVNEMSANYAPRF